jgi:hypothetical protein
MYMWIGFLALSDCKKRSCATTTLAIMSSTGPIKQMIRSFKRRE